MQTSACQHDLFIIVSRGGVLFIDVHLVNVHGVEQEWHGSHEYEVHPVVRRRRRRARSTQIKRIHSSARRTGTAFAGVSVTEIVPTTIVARAFRFK